MPDLQYVYAPTYGVEPYKDNNGLGGANVTQENLLITTWTITNKGAPPPNYIQFGQILKPQSVNTLATPAERAASVQGMASRYSTKFYFQPFISEVPGETVEAPLALVLNPPAEYKQQLAGAVQYNGGDPTLLTSFTVQKSLQGCYAWRQLNTEAPLRNSDIVASGSEALFSTYLPLTANVFALPFLKTNGADGVAPTFFDASTSAGIKQMIEAIDDGGEFYVLATLFPPDSSVSAYFNMYWPHSTARG